MYYCKRTIFNTPVLKTLLRVISIIVLKLSGWKIQGKAPNLKKYVMIAAPHTFNWDFVYTLLMAFALNLKVYMMGKKELLGWTFGSFFKWLGLIPIDRSRANNVVNQAVDLFNSRDRLILIIPPSGTRKIVKKWKTGFYHIAHLAKVPIALGFLDYARKTGGIGHLYVPTGDIDSDMQYIKNYYADITGKYPEHCLHYVPIKAVGR